MPDQQIKSQNVVHETEIVVVGAGVIGCSVAYHLSARGAAVTVLDAGPIGGGTSTATFGHVWVQGKEPVEYLRLGLASARLHGELAQRYEVDVELRQNGGLEFCLDESQLEAAHARRQRLADGFPDYQARVISPAEARELEPLATPHLLGATYSPYDGHVNPEKLVNALAQLAQKHGAIFRLNERVTQIVQSEAGVAGVDTSRGRIRARRVVVAAGFWSPALLEPLGLHIPIGAVRGQVLVTEALPPRLRHTTLDVRQTIAGNILLGATHEPGVRERGTTGAGAEKIRRETARQFPFLGDLSIVEHFSGIRAMPQDGLPHLGPVGRVPGLYVAVSHSGITLAPMLGQVMSQLILDGKTEQPIAGYGPERFMAVEDEV